MANSNPLKEKALKQFEAVVVKFRSDACFDRYPEDHPDQTIRDTYVYHNTEAMWKRWLSHMTDGLTRKIF